MGNMCTPMADACWCMAKPIQHCKVKKIIIIIKKIKKKISGPHSFTGKFYITFKKEVLPILHDSSRKLNKKYFPTHSVKLKFIWNHTRPLKKKRNYKKRNLENNISHEYRCKKLVNIIANYIQWFFKGQYNSVK